MADTTPIMTNYQFHQFMNEVEKLMTGAQKLPIEEAFNQAVRTIVRHREQLRQTIQTATTAMENAATPAIRQQAQNTLKHAESQLRLTVDMGFQRMSYPAFRSEVTRHAGRALTDARGHALRPQNMSPIANTARNIQRLTAENGGAGGLGLLSRFRNAVVGVSAAVAGAVGRLFGRGASTQALTTMTAIRNFPSYVVGLLRSAFGNPFGIATRFVQAMWAHILSALGWIASLAGYLAGLVTSAAFWYVIAGLAVLTVIGLIAFGFYLENNPTYSCGLPTVNPGNPNGPLMCLCADGKWYNCRDTF